MKFKENSQTRFKMIVGFFMLIFIQLLTISCNDRVSDIPDETIRRRKSITTDDGLVKVTGEDEGGSFECEGIDSELTDPENLLRVPTTDNYDCKDGQLIINR